MDKRTPFFRVFINLDRLVHRVSMYDCTNRSNSLIFNETYLLAVLVMIVDKANCGIFTFSFYSASQSEFKGSVNKKSYFL